MPALPQDGDPSQRPSQPSDDPSFARTLRDLEHIRDTCAASDDRNGYFAAMYGRVTAAVAARASAGRFDDATRMEQFVDLFARRYTEAYWARAADQKTTTAWALAFDTAVSSSPLVVQHLLLGMNAHINLDLGIVAVQIARQRGEPLEGIRRDYDAINGVLAEMVDRCQGAVVASSPLLAAADALLGGHDEAATRFSLRVARDGAWTFAQSLAESTEQAAAIDERDRAVRAAGERLLTRAGSIHGAQRLVRATERRSVASVIDDLASVEVD